MRKYVWHTLILIALASCMPPAVATTIDVRLRIRQEKTEEKTITRGNLIKIQQFILQQGKRETYCNLYNDNPAHRTKNYNFYLNPDTKQKNGNCDLTKSGFHNLTIRTSKGGENQYRTVEFLDKHYVYITANWPTSDLSVQQIRQFVVDAMIDILAQIKKKKA